MAKTSKQAQSIIELAVFGSILFFLISGIASVYMSGSFQQNMMLQTMRQALYNSYETARQGHASRNGSTFLLFEDRLSGEFGKYGTADRQPLALMGTGTFSKNLMLPIDFNERHNLPLLDVRVNGQTFNFTTNMFIKYKIFLVNDAAAPANVDAANAEDVQIYRFMDCNTMHGDPSWVDICPGTTLNGKECFKEIKGPENELMRKRLAFEWKKYSIEVDTSAYPPFYTNIVANNAEWNIDDTPETRRKFDYNRNGDFTDDFQPEMSVAGGNVEYWKNFAVWQWFWHPLSTVAGKIDGDEGSYPAYDVNGDMQEETIYGLGAAVCPGYYSGYHVAALTPSAAEWNTEKQREDYVDPNMAQGMRSDMRIYTTMAGTALNIREGTTYSADGRPVNISTTTKQQVDVVERVLQLNRQMVAPQWLVDRNNTNADGSPKVPPVIEVSCGDPDGEATVNSCCGDNAIDDTRLSKTCFDLQNKILYIRSRINDNRGRKWITSTDQDFLQTLGLKP